MRVFWPSSVNGSLRSLVLSRPQYHLASNIGVKPESLSRVQKRIAQINS